MLRTVVCVVVALAWFANPVAAQGKKAPEKAPAKVKIIPALKGEYSIMASKLELTAEQQTKLAEIVQAHKKAADEGTKADKANVVDAQKTLTEAKKKKDNAAAVDEAKKAVAAAQAAVKTNKEALDTKEKADIQALLTDEQKTRWVAFNVYRTVMRDMAWAKLTQAQKTKTEAAADELTPKMRSEGKTEEDIVAAVKAKALELLTDAQKGLAKPAKDKKPAAEDAKKEL